MKLYLAYPIVQFAGGVKMAMKIFGKRVIVAVVLLAVFLLGSGVPADRQAWASDTACMPCIDLIKTGPATALPGDVITYAYTVKNCGNVLLGSGAFVYDYLFQTDPIWTGNLAPQEMVTFYRNYTIPMDKCGEFVNTAMAVGIPDEYVAACAGIPNATDSDSHTVFVNCESEAPGTGTPGYWKNHPEAWPVSSIMIGGFTYSKEDAISHMSTAGKGDKYGTMFNALVAAKLNVLIGNNSSCIASTIAAADAWMAQYLPVVRGNSYAWSLGEPLYRMLDRYNNGGLCAPRRE
jgi:hypothetical protein